MNFEPNHIYHIYNQGNNRQKIFFTRENYLFFLKKIGEHILPFADILAWCLMPNHFHLMIYIRNNSSSEGFTPSEALTIQNQSEALTKPTPSETLTTTTYKTLNDSIGVLLRSYTRAINKQQNRTGSLFRKETKAECIDGKGRLQYSEGFTQSEALTNTSKSEALTKTPLSEALTIPTSTETPTEKEHLQTCFNYIHQNPVRSGLVENHEEWEFSSWQEYYGVRIGKLINKERSAKLGLII